MVRQTLVILACALVCAACRESSPGASVSRSIAAPDVARTTSTPSPTDPLSGTATEEPGGAQDSTNPRTTSGPETLEQAPAATEKSPVSESRPGDQPASTAAPDPVGRIAGFAIDHQGRAVSGVCVSVRDLPHYREANSDIAVTHTDGAGRFSLQVPAGEYVVAFNLCPAADQDAQFYQPEYWKDVSPDATDRPSTVKVIAGQDTVIYATLLARHV